MEQPPNRIERHGHHGGGHHGQGEVRAEPATDRGADPHDDRNVDSGDEQREPAEDDRLVDDDVDVVEPVAENGDADGQRESQQRRHEDVLPSRMEPDGVQHV